MNAKTEKAFAGHLLHHGEHGYSLLYILRKSVFRYLALLAVLAGCILLNRMGLLAGRVLIFVAGLLAGAVARDVGWIRQGKRIWPLYADGHKLAEGQGDRKRGTASVTSEGVQPAEGTSTR